MCVTMNDLQASILDVHGGLASWNAFEKVEASIVSGGGFFSLKGTLQDTKPRQMTVWRHEERSSVAPYGAPDQRTVFTPDRIAVEKLDGTIVAERYQPRDSFAGHQMSTSWDTLHRPYFNGEALWTYLTTPFLSQWMECVLRRPSLGPAGQSSGTCFRHLAWFDRDAQSNSGFIFR